MYPRFSIWAKRAARIAAYIFQMGKASIGIIRIIVLEMKKSWLYMLPKGFTMAHHKQRETHIH